VITIFADANRYVMFFAVWNDGGEGEGPVSIGDMLLIIQVVPREQPQQNILNKLPPIIWLAIVHI